MRRKVLKPGWYWVVGLLNLPQVVKVDEEGMVWMAGTQGRTPLKSLGCAVTFRRLNYPRGWKAWRGPRAPPSELRRTRSILSIMAINQRIRPQISPKTPNIDNNEGDGMSDWQTELNREKERILNEESQDASDAAAMDAFANGCGLLTMPQALGEARVCLERARTLLRHAVDRRPYSEGQRAAVLALASVNGAVAVVTSLLAHDVA